MAETYLITAKTVEEAVSVAKREYEDARHEVNYEIVEMPKKGFLGIGAKPAKIKVTVSKVMTVQSELGSLVADIKNMKNMTDRDGQAPKEPKEQKPQENPQGRKQQNQQNQPRQQNQPKQQNQQPKQGQNQPKPQNQQGQQGQPKPQNQPQQNQQPKQNQNPPKAEAKPQQNETKPQNQNQNQQNQNQRRRQHNQPAQQAKKPGTEEAVPTPAAPVVPAPVVTEPAPAVPETAAAEPAETTHRSALGNQAKPSRRSRQKKSSSANASEPSVAASGVTVSAPVGLTDFVSEVHEGTFGAETGTPASSGRMSNDVRRRNRQQAKPQTPAVPAVPAPVVVAPAKKDENPAPVRENRSRRRPASIQKAANEEMASRYDIAESDEDYEKLDALMAESEGRGTSEPVITLAGSEPAEAPARNEDRRREAITREEMDYALAFANTLLENMKLDARAVAAECPEDEDFIVTETADVYPKIDIVGTETGILIGHHGETLDSIQYLVNLSALRKTKSKDGDYVKIVVDIENYRKKREDTLRSLARRMAARAVRYRRNVFLEPMNAYERRIIHSELQSFENVSTHSVGADRDRKIIITYEGPGRAPDKAGSAAEKPAQPAVPEGRRRRRGGDEAEQNAEGSRRRRGSSASEEAPEAERRERDRRPRKQTKMPIEQLTDWLPDAGNVEIAPAGSVEAEDDSLHVMSGLREAYLEGQEEAAELMEQAEEAAEAAEDAAEEAVAEAVETVEDKTVEAVAEAVEAVEDKAEEAVADAVETVEEAAEPVEAVAEAVEEAEPEIAEAVEAVKAEIPETAEEIVEEAVEAVEESEDKAEEAAETVSEPAAEILAAVEEAKEEISEIAEDAETAAADPSFEEKAKALTDILGTIGEDPKDEDGAE